MNETHISLNALGLGGKGASIDDSSISPNETNVTLASGFGQALWPNVPPEKVFPA